MTKKQLQQLVSQTYTNAVLDRSKLQSVSKKLSRADLKQFIKAVRMKEQLNNVYITLPHEPSKNVQEKFSSLFQNKKIVYNIDSTIMPGMKINFGDLLYEVSLKERLQKLISYIEQSYD